MAEGVLTKAGLIKDGKVTEAAWKGYIEDVKKMLATGEGIFPPGVTCSRPVEPTKGASMLDLSDESAFPEFHKIWRARYENMILSLDVPGDIQIAKTFPPAAMLVDPTAVAAAIGIKPPKLDLIEALVKMQASPPLIPPSPAYFTFNFPDINPTDILNIIASADFLKLIAPTPPIPPIPKLPAPKLLDFGYTDQFKFETDLALAPLIAHLEMMVPAVAAANLPKIIVKLAQGDVLGGLISFVCEQVGSKHPKPMSTSSFEIAAQQVLLQHQVKCQALGFVGQQIGAGVITNGLATTPFVNGGLGLLRKEEIVSEPDEFLEATLLSERRLRAGQIIRDVVPFSRDAKGKISGRTFYEESKSGQGFRRIAPSFSAPVIKGIKGVDDKSGDDAWDYVDALRKVAQGEAQNVIESAVGTVAAIVNETVIGLASDFGGSKTKPFIGGSNQYVSKLKNLKPDDAKKLLATISEKSPIFNTSRSYTTCGEMPRYLYDTMLTSNSPGKINNLVNDSKFVSGELAPGRATPSILRTSQETGKKIKGGKSGKEPLKSHIADGGLASLMVTGRALEELQARKENRDVHYYRGTIFKITDPFCGAERKFWMDKNNHPSLGDAILTGPYSSSNVWGRQDGGKLKVDLSNVLEVFGPSSSKEYFYLPGQRPIVHVSIMYEWSYEDGIETWTTVDAGQGSKANQGAAYKRKKVFRDPFYGIMVLAESDTNVVPLGGRAGDTRIIMGWLDIDKIPELGD